MKKSLIFTFAAAVSLLLVGCSGGQTSQSDVNSAAQDLSKSAAGTTPAPNNPYKIVGGGKAGGTGTAMKPHGGFH